jgi:rhamnosyltransferase
MKRLKETGVIIPTYNAMSCDTFPNLIKLLLSAKNDLGRILIIDSSSDDKTVEFATKAGFEVVVITQKEFNHGATRDMGVKILSDKYFLKYVIFLTQDALLASIDSLYAIIDPFDDDLIGAVCGRQVPHDNANPLAKHSRFFNYQETSRINTKLSIPKLGIKTAFMSNSFAAYDIRILHEINGFPNDIIISEDMYVSAKMILNDYKTYYCADAIVKHSHNYLFFEEFKRYFDIGVFHASCPFLLDEFRSPSKEGKRYLISELKYTFNNGGLLWFFNSLIRSFLKIVAYKLGTQYLKININLCRLMSMDRNYWK